MTLPTSSRGAVARLLKRRLRNAQQLAAVQFFLLLAPAQLEHARADVQVLVEALAVEGAEQTRPQARLGELEIRVTQHKALSGWNPPIATWRLGDLAHWPHQGCKGHHLESAQVNGSRRNLDRPASSVISAPRANSAAASKTSDDTLAANASGDRSRPRT